MSNIDDDVDAYGQHRIHTSEFTVKENSEENKIDEKISDQDTIRIKEQFGNCSTISL